MYSTLAGIAYGKASIDGSDTSGQLGFIALPMGWEVAPDNSDSRIVIAKHGWSAVYVVVSGGSRYPTFVNSMPSPVAGELLSDSSMRFFKPKSNNTHVLIRK